MESNHKTLCKMNKRLKIITIAVGVVYAIIVIGQVYRGIPSFIEGFKAGYNDTRVGRGYSPKTFYLSLRPENGFYTFPTTIVNQLDNIPMSVEFERVVVEIRTDVRERVPKRLTTARNLALYLFSPIMIYVILMVPIQVFRIVRSVTRNKFFDFRNIKRLRKVGYALLLFYLVNLVYNYIYYKIATHIVHIEGYSVQMQWGNEILLLLGFVVLMFAEVLKISVPLKEEQDLTV